MRMSRRRILTAGAIGLLAGVGGFARAALEAGRDFKQLGQPLATETGSRIEVLEFFWYGCPHCFDLEPVMEKWLKKAPADVELRRVPAIFRDTWAPGARLYYALEALGELKRLHGEVFDAIHIHRIPLHTDEKVMASWLEKKGVERKKFQDTYSSFAMQGRVARAQQITRASRIDGVPAIIVDGRYLTSGSMAGTYDAMMGVIDELLQRVRAERGNSSK